MLISLNVSNFALIDRLELTFGDGLNILTGETGAGKSIIIDALGIALGERTSIDMVRGGTDKLSVEAMFLLPQTTMATKQRLVENGLENDDDPEVLILSRELSRSGKSQGRVNGRLVTTSILRQIGQELVDVHGQHEHQSLLADETHIDLLDNWLGGEVLQMRSAANAAYNGTLKLRKDLSQILSNSRERARAIDLYKFERKEIIDAGLKPSEEIELESERKKLTNSEKLRASSEDAYTLLQFTVTDALNRSLALLSKSGDLDEDINPIVQQLTESSAYLEEATALLRRYKETLDSEPGRLEIVNERLDLIHSLERKFGGTVQEVLNYAKDLEQKIYDIEDSDARESDIRRQLVEFETRLGTISEKLTALRVKGAKNFSKAIIGELADLGMNQTVFEASVSSQQATGKGVDRVQFLLSTNPGEPLKPLARVASGGETSRLMLAIKSVLARSSFVPTMIFDEIDTGIGGRTGRVIADKLAALSEIAQILCITHLPQIASRPSATHFSIEKHVLEGRTTVSVLPLDPNQREIEIARMLGGDSSQTVLQHAREMLSAR